MGHLVRVQTYCSANMEKIADTFVSSCWKALLPTATNWVATESMLPKHTIINRKQEISNKKTGAYWVWTKQKANLQCKAPNKRSQHVNATYRSIVGRNMLSAFDYPVAPFYDMLDVVGSNLTIFKLDPTTPSMSQQGGQTRAICCAQQCCDMLRWHVAIVWPALNI